MPPPGENRPWRRRSAAARWIRIRVAAVDGMRSSDIGSLLWMSVIAGMYIRKLLGQPWRSFRRPVDWKDRQSRDMVGDAVLMYRQLLRKVSPQRALDAARRVIYSSAMQFLSDSMPEMNRDFFNRTERELERDVISLVDRFPNTDYRIDSVKYPRLRYLVSRCRFVELAAALGHGELATAFCAADGDFFRERQPLIRMHRPKTIAAGDGMCDFDFAIKLDDAGADSPAMRD
jgi:hypothetical protein